MGLSILIPVYNYNVTSLVQALSAQLISTGKQGEIILLDDGSQTAFIDCNKSLADTELVSFHTNTTNQGRTASRKKLSSLAQYDYLLFLDCDSEIISNDFLNTYFELIEKEITLASGGREYTAQQPSCEFMLHWKYGSKRESRKNNDGNIPAFMSNNFLIKKPIFENLNNSFNLPGYGHEDTWWGIQFEQLGIQCMYIDNPVLHAGLETSIMYLEKTENAIDNLLLLKERTSEKIVSKHIKLFRYYSRLKNSGLAAVYSFVEKPFHAYLRRNILSCKPSLFYFDCYRLAMLIRKSNKKN